MQTKRDFDLCKWRHHRCRMYTVTITYMYSVDQLFIRWLAAGEVLRVHPHRYIQQVVLAILQEDAANEVCAMPSDVVQLAVSDQIPCDIVIRIFVCRFRYMDFLAL